MPVGNDNPNDGRNMHISSLSYKTTEDELNDMFSKYGKVSVPCPCVARVSCD